MTSTSKSSCSFFTRRFSLRVNPVYRQLVGQIQAARSGRLEAPQMDDREKQHIREYVTRAQAPRLDRLDRGERLLGVGDADPAGRRRVLEGAVEIPVVVEIPDEVLGDRQQPLRQHDPHVPGQVFRERLLGLRADDRIELVVLVVALHQARALEGLGVLVLLGAARFSGAEAGQTDPTAEWIPAQRADLRLLEIESRILIELLIDDVLELEGGQLKDVIGGDLFRSDLELLLRQKSQVHIGYLSAGDRDG